MRHDSKPLAEIRAKLAALWRKPCAFAFPGVQQRNSCGVSKSATTPAVPTQRTACRPLSSFIFRLAHVVKVKQLHSFGGSLEENLGCNGWL